MGPGRDLQRDSISLFHSARSRERVRIQSCCSDSCSSWEEFYSVSKVTVDHCAYDGVKQGMIAWKELI